jgi:hypothetical protein
MPNSKELFGFLTATHVKSFFAFFGALEGASSFDSIGRGCSL